MKRRFRPRVFRRVSWFGTILLALCFVSGVAAYEPGQAAQQPPAPEQQRELACSIADGFTLATVGDLIIVHPESMLNDPEFQSALKIIRQAEVAFGNMETSLIDIRRFPGYPQAEYGGMWLIGSPSVAKDVKAMGFGLVSRANNHTTDWGIEGMRETDRALDESGIVHAGTGENRAAARSARFLNVPSGRIALVSMASSYTPLSAAMPTLGEAPGRPGLNALRIKGYVIVTEEMMKNLRKIREAQPKGSIEPPPADQKENPKELELFGIRYRLGKETGFSFGMDPVDLREILKSIRQGKENSDFLAATIHGHEPGNWSEEPADFLPVLAHQAIDAGADAFIGHGPHQLRGIEVYKGKPIFYSLGNFFFQVSIQEPVAQDMYEMFEKDPASLTDNEFNVSFLKKYFGEGVWYQTVIAVSRFDKGQVSEIRLYPVELRFDSRQADQGIPRLASPDVARKILERLQRLSTPYHTVINIEENVGVIRPNK